ncbi:MAG: Holliday junction resolvase RuvX [Planctomycetota bacterium]|nr:Holliday junction resolvase RuvX [Planctomycetota bacterium]
MGRWLGIDYGHKRIGVAAGRSEDGIASPLTVLEGLSLAAAIEKIRLLAQEYQAAGVVVGWALNMDDTEGPQGLLTRQAAAALAAATGLDVRMWDERLSSFSADKALAGQMTRKKRRGRQDALAAAKILEDFFASDGPSHSLPPDRAQAPKQ